MSVQSLTVTATQQQYLVLRLPASVSQKAGALFEQLQKSKLFDQQALARWKGNFDKASFKTPEERDEAAQMLCFLLCEIVQPAIIKADRDGEIAIVHFEEEIKAILEQLLPKEVAVDAYIEQFQIYIGEKLRLDQQTGEVDALFLNKLQELELATQKAKAAACTTFEEHKASLLEELQEEEQGVEQLHNGVDALGQRMNAAHGELRETARQMEALVVDVQKEQQNLRRVAEEGLALLRRVR